MYKKPIPDIRILPMSQEVEFPRQSIEDVQYNYFLKKLINQNGQYYYRKSGLNSCEGSFVLFQFDKSIIAAATLVKIEKYKNPFKGEYYGAYIFDIESIAVFKPIIFDEIHNIDNSVMPFSRTKQKIDYSYLTKVKELIKSKQSDFS